MPSRIRSLEAVKNSPVVAEDLAAWRGNNYNVRAAARALGKARSTVQGSISDARHHGLIDEVECGEASAPLAEAVLSARTRKIAAFQAKQRKGNWDKPVLVNLPEGPFRLKVFGDPHMDSNAFDIEQWEKHWFEMDAANRVLGVCIGDWFNNWLRVLGHLWKHEGDPDDAWTLFEHYMAERGDALVAACSGNHDDWSHGPVDPIDLVMKQNGVIYRKGAVRLILNCGGERVTMALRHKWKGNSQYSPAHALRRAAAEGWHDNIMVGGHIHQDEDRHFVVPRTGIIANLFQVSAFKKYDDYADVHGFKPHAISPVRDLVVDPRRPDTDPDKVKAFYDSDAAAAYLDAIR